MKGDRLLLTIEINTAKSKQDILRLRKEYSFLSVIIRPSCLPKVAGKKTGKESAQFSPHGSLILWLNWDIKARAVR